MTGFVPWWQVNLPLPLRASVFVVRYAAAGVRAFRSLQGAFRQENFENFACAQHLGTPRVRHATSWVVLQSTFDKLAFLFYI